MSRLILIRHASTDEMNTVLCGRKPGVHLSQYGVFQAKQMGESIRKLRVAEIVTGPLERAVETAHHMAADVNCPVIISAAFDECDFGEWTGLPFSSLETVPGWIRFNSFRSLLSAPSGESLYDVQYRAIIGIRRFMQERSELDRIVVTHADVIRAVLCFFLASPLDLHLRYALNPASFTVLDVNEYGFQVTGINLPSIA
jgi:broad specificity phosphatase PhoE